MIIVAFGVCVCVCVCVCVRVRCFHFSLSDMSDLIFVFSQ